MDNNTDTAQSSTSDLLSGVGNPSLYIPRPFEFEQQSLYDNIRKGRIGPQSRAKGNLAYSYLDTATAISKKVTKLRREISRCLDLNNGKSVTRSDLLEQISQLDHCRSCYEFGYTMNDGMMTKENENEYYQTKIQEPTDEQFAA